MFSFMLFSTLFSSIFAEPGEQRWVCNSSDVSVWYTYCDDMKVPISIEPKPCITLKGSKGYLHLSYIPRRDIKKLYFNIYLSFNSMDFPMRKEVVCRGSDDLYSFCRALKGGQIAFLKECINLYIISSPMCKYSSLISVLTVDTII
ncbi:lymphocyte antigen 96 isoform X2 [Lutra lutra]|uniref:lymphocyte antigen 96 isoform X2 n=1 Tax=Lutra lutra TaxID=9657 RepID=UPI001FD025BF|nr:lymphocyte antigen 96 isoform X2 [Lutra lutra]